VPKVDELVSMAEMIKKIDVESEQEFVSNLEELD